MSDVILVVLWGTIAGLDLVTGPQIMIARPLVAGTVAGALLGDVTSGLIVGVVLELYALEVLPVGGSRYADYGPASAAAAMAAAGAPLQFAVGPAVLLGLAVAWLGEESMQIVRRRNDRRVHAWGPALDRGDAGALLRLQMVGIGIDTIRAALVTAVGLTAALVIRDVIVWPGRSATLLSLLVVAAGVGTAIAAALRVSGHGAAVRWLIVGGAVGLAFAVLS